MLAVALRFTKKKKLSFPFFFIHLGVDPAHS